MILRSLHIANCAKKTINCFLQLWMYGKLMFKSVVLDIVNSVTILFVGENLCLSKFLSQEMAFWQGGLPLCF